MSDNTGLLPSQELQLVIPQQVAMRAATMASEAAVEPPVQIHRRNLLPPLPEGPAVPDTTPSAPQALAPPMAVDALRATPALAATDNLVLVENVPLGSVIQQDFTSEVGEPSVASRANTVFFTGNWYAAVSEDGGNTFQRISPFTQFLDPEPGSRFCCDQVVHYIRSLDAFVWLLQYTTTPSGNNRQRLAFARTADVRVGGTWKIVDITSQNLGVPGVMLDFPDLAVGDNMLYMTTNVCQGGFCQRSAVVRLALAGIRNLLDGTGQPTAQFVMADQLPSFRIAQQCRTRAFWATHLDTSTIRLFTWPEAAAEPTSQDIEVASWSDGNRQSQTPDGFNWMGRSDRRMVGATRRNGDELWFAWSAGRGGANNRPQPYVQIARLGVTGATATLLENVNLWEPDLAVAYAALSTNSRDEVGVSYFVGGPTKHTSLVVGFLTDPRQFTVAADGGHGPEGGQWGDYVAVRRHYGTTQRLFAASGYTIDSEAGQRRRNPRFVLFGRASDVTS